MDEYGFGPVPEIDDDQLDGWLDDWTECSLSDGRTFVVQRVGPGSETTPHLGPTWAVGRTPDDVFVGHPLNSLIAARLGYEIAHEEWPVEIDELAASLEARLSEK